ncbi:hypothetical protein LCGC14_3021910, partial [marine sediment metagenome]
LDPDNFNRPIAHYWINGTTGDISISSHNDDSYRVLRQRLMVINILAVYDTGNNLISTGPSNVIAYRGYTLELNVSYIRTDLTPVNSSGFTVYYNQSLNAIVQIGSGTTILATGNQVFNTTLSGAGTIYPGSAQLYAEPTDPLFNSTNTFFQPFNFRIKATPTIVFDIPSTNVSDSDTLRDGDVITISGELRDEIGLLISDTNYLNTTLDELISNILVYGTNQDQSVNHSGTVSTNLTALGNFVISYTIPNGFANENITLRIELNSIVSIPSFDSLNTFVQTVFTYQFVNLSVLLDSDTGGAPFPVSYTFLSNDSTYNIDGSLLDYYAIISFDDNYGRPLQNYSYILYDNTSTSIPITTNSA